MNNFDWKILKDINKRVLTKRNNDKYKILNEIFFELKTKILNNLMSSHVKYKNFT